MFDRKAIRRLLATFPLSLAYNAYVRSKACDPNLREYLRDQNDWYFRQLSVTRPDADERHRAVMSAVGLAMSDAESFHRIAFAALELSGFRPENVLGLGTHLAQTTAFLSELFPKAGIHTVDLPPGDPLFADHKPKGEAWYQQALGGRDERAGVTAHRTNTLFLQSLDLPDFDLIWLDAGHDYPEVAWDHFYCQHKLRPGGWLFSDDVTFPQHATSGKAPPIYETITYLNDRCVDKFRFLVKREDPVQFIQQPKHLGVLHKSTC